MDVSKLPYHEQKQIRELQALLRDYREGKTPTETRRFMRLIEHLTLRLLISPDEGIPNA